MNYYNPYFYSIPTSVASSTGAARGLGGLLSKINFGSIINGTSRTLNLVNQALPIFKQMSPVVRNAKTMFKVMNEFKKTDIPTNNENNNTTNNINDNDISTATETSIYSYANNVPTFFA